MPHLTPLPTPRAWQKAALNAFFASGQTDWLTVATPGAGKTTYGLSAASRLWQYQQINQLAIVAPTAHLRDQWIEAAAQFGFDLRDIANAEPMPAGVDGWVATYAQVGSAPGVHAARLRGHRTMVLFDEIHHAADDKRWGSGVLDAFEQATVRFGLTGTPFRGDSSRIAHVRYEPDAEGNLVCQPDYTYGYGDALRDRVVRPVQFVTYGGLASWETPDGDVRNVNLGSTDMDYVNKSDENHAWSTVLSPRGEWMPHAMDAAWSQVQHLRATTIPDAKVLIPAADQDTARAYAELWERVTGGDRPEVVLSDDAEAASRLARFRDDPAVTCAVCVRMITEGVDVPAVAVVVYATKGSTPLFFAQMIGRALRARHEREVATVIMPAVRPLLGLAQAMEREVEHVIKVAPEEGLEVVDESTATEPDGERARNVAQRSEAVLHDVATYCGDGLFDLPADQARALWEREEEQRRKRAQEVAAQRIIAAGPRTLTEEKAPARKVSASAQSRELRSRISKRVAHMAQVKGTTPQEAWGRLYRAVPGARNDSASVELLQQRLDWLTR